MTQASPHDEQMKNFMGTESLVSGIKDWKLQGVDHATYRVDDTTSQKPAKSRSRESADNFTKSQDADPAHSNVDHGREPLGAGDPERFDQNPCNGDPPDKSLQHPSGVVT